MFPIHYVPILRWKQAERLALKELLKDDRKMVTPLIEITPKSFDPPKTGKHKNKKPDPARVLEDQAKNLLESWENEPLFLDLSLIDGRVPPINGVRHPLAHIAETARSYRLCVVPVTGLTRREEYQTAVSNVIHEDKRGICLRLLAREVLEPKFVEAVRSLLSRINLDESSVSLRYTLEDKWLVMRGEAPRGKVASENAERRPGREQYNAHAQLLCEDAELFYGQDFSWGDVFIYERGVNKTDHGNAEIWLRAGINHHMTVVSRQIANLAAP